MTSTRVDHRSALDGCGVRRVDWVEGSTSVAGSLMSALGLLLLSGFLWTKISFNTQGTGWLFLPAFWACVMIVTTVRLKEGNRLCLAPSAPWTTIFVLWLLIRLGLDSDSLVDVVSYTIGYGEGILFAYGTGVAASILLDSFSRARSAGLRWSGTMALLMFNAWSAMWVEQTALSAGSLHRDYAFFYNDTYQVSGALASVLLVVLSSLFVRSVGESGRGVRRFARWTLMLTAAVTFFTTARLAQLLGSNAGPAFMLPVAVLSIAMAWVDLRIPVKRHSGCGVGGANMFWRALVSVGARTICLAVLVVGAFLLAVVGGSIDITQYRIFGFEEASLHNTSVDSRFRLLTSNFSTHLAYAPLLGNFFVDRLTTGEGSYAHGLIAVVPHLGLVGAVLFVAMFVGVGGQLRVRWLESRRSPPERRFAMFAILLIAWVLAFMLLTTFFTNILLWLTLGIVSPAVIVRGRLARPFTRGHHLRG